MGQTQHSTCIILGSLMKTNERLLESIWARGIKQSEFGYGILTADKHVQNVLDHVGLDNCYRFAAKRQMSFDDVLQKSKKTLVYSNNEMLVKEHSDTMAGVTLPPNTLMVFRHVLTSTRKDRDGDILRTAGAEVDDRMLLLWQHVHTLPIGKMLKVHSKTSDRLELVTAIVDMNELSHDAAVMVDNDMARFSHGFRALEFDELKAEEGETTAPGGFDVKRFEIMEESMVSVPSNVDATVEETVLSLVEGGKMTSPLMKCWGQGIREKQPVSVPVGGGKRVVIQNTVWVDDEEELTNEGEPKGAEQGTKGPSEKADEHADDKGTNEAAGAGDTEVKSALSGSWEDIESNLRMKAGPYLASMGIDVTDHMIWIVGTFSDHAIVCVEKRSSNVIDEFRYFKIAWVMQGDEPVFTGTPEPVEINVSVESAQRSPAYEEKAQAVPALNAPGLTKARRLATAGKVIEPDEWTPPSAADQNAYIEENGIGEFSKWHLGVKEGVDPETRGAWAFPFTSDFENVDAAGLTAIRQRAGQQNNTAIFEAAGSVVEIIGGEEEDKSAVTDTKTGRVISKANENLIRESKEGITEVSQMENVPRPAKALARESARNLGKVLDAIGGDGETSHDFTIKDAMVLVYSKATSVERQKLLETLEAMKQREERSKQVHSFHTAVGG